MPQEAFEGRRFDTFRRREANPHCRTAHKGFSQGLKRCFVSAKFRLFACVAACNAEFHRVHVSAPLFWLHAGELTPARGPFIDAAVEVAKVQPHLLQGKAGREQPLQSLAGQFAEPARPPQGFDFSRILCNRRIQRLA